MSPCAIGSLVDHCIDILGEGGDEAGLRCGTRNLDRTQPKSIKISIIRRACNVYQDTNILSCDLTKLWLPLGAFLVRVPDSVHDHLGIEARALIIDFVGELVVDEKESHEITSYSNTI